MENILRLLLLFFITFSAHAGPYGILDNQIYDDRTWSSEKINNELDFLDTTLSASISANTAAIESNDIDIANVSASAAYNLSLININISDIATVSQSASDNLAAIISNDLDIATVSQSAAANALAISDNAADILSNTNAINSVSGSVSSNLSLININISDIATVSGSLSTHIGDFNNPHLVTKAQVGLGNADNTSDADKPVSTAQQAALDLKYDASNPNGYETPLQLDARDTANRSRANHTGTQLASTISDFDTEVSNNSSVTANTAKVSNANHTGEVTGDTALTVQPLAISNKTLKASPVGTEEILINDSGTLKKVNVSSISGMAIYGSNYHYAESENESSTSSGIYQEKLKLTTSSLPSGNYLIQWSAEVKTNDEDMLVRCQVNDTTLINEVEHSEGADGGGETSGTYDYYTTVSGIRQLNLSGVTNIDIDYNDNTGGTAFIRRARITIWRVN